MNTKSRFVTSMLAALMLLTMLIGAGPVHQVKAEAAESPLTASGDFTWAKGMGGKSSSLWSNGTVADANGNIYVTGCFEDDWDFDPGPAVAALVSNGLTDIFIYKLDGAGNLAWVRGMGGAGYDCGQSIAVDPSGNFYLTGSFEGTVDVDPGAGAINLTGGGNFISKFDTNGNLVWAMGGSSGMVGGNVTLDANLNIYLMGSFEGTVDFNPGAGVYKMTSPAGVASAFITRLDNKGNFVWAKGMGKGGTTNTAAEEIPGQTYVNSPMIPPARYPVAATSAVAIDSNGNVYSTGTFNDVVDFDPGPGTFNLEAFAGNVYGMLDVYISKFDVNGNFVWAKRIGGIGDDRGLNIGLDTGGNVYATGSFEDTVDFDPGAGTSNLTGGGHFELKLNNGGNFVWAHAGLGEYTFIDPNGNVYKAGSFYGTADFDPSPATYNLTSAGEADIYLSKYNTSGQFVWAKRIGGADTDFIYQLELDASGRVYLLGQFVGTVDFDPGAGTFNMTSSSGDGDIFIARFDENGNFGMAENLGEQFAYGYSEGFNLAADLSGNIYTTGRFWDTVDFDPGPNTFNLVTLDMYHSGIFVSKLDTSGNFVWAKGISGLNHSSGYDVAVDADNNVYLAGSFGGTVDFDPGDGVANLISNGDADIFVCKLDSNGNYLWARNMGGANADEGYSVSVDMNGNVYVTGFFLGTADFDPGAGGYNLVSAGGNDIFVSRLDRDGNFVQSFRMGGSGDDYGYSITVDLDGAIYTTGRFTGTADFDPGASASNLTSAGGFDVFVSKLNGLGNLMWVKPMGGAGNDGGVGLTVDSNGNVYTTGNFSGIADFDPGAGVSNLLGTGNSDTFVSKLDKDGNFGWAKGMLGTSESTGNNIVLDEDKDVYVTGRYKGTVDFNPDAGVFNMTAWGTSPEFFTDGFVTKLDGNGKFTWAKGVGGELDDEGIGIALDSNGNIYTSGSFQETVDFDPGPGTFPLTSMQFKSVFVSKLAGDAQSSAFTDVSFTYPLSPYIEALYASGYTAGCSSSPMMYCPDTILNRAQSAVFMLRGQKGSGYTPPAVTGIFSDSWTGFEWAQGWAEGMYVEGLTAGCQSSPLMFCPANQLPRVEASIFGLRMKYGTAYVPPAASGTLFADFPSTDPSYWGIDWAEQAYNDGLLPACGTQNGKPMFCPNQLVDRGWGAYLIVKAKNLPLP